MQQSLPDQDPVLTLAMATGANNNTEYVKGYTSIQWAYGKQTSWSLDELRQQLSLPIDRQQQEFLRLLNQRELAEDCARKAKARLVLSKLKNSSIRQPIRTFKMAEPVYIWRKFLPHTIYAGEKGSADLDLPASEPSVPLKIQHFVRSLSLHNAFCIAPATKSAHGGSQKCCACHEICTCRFTKCCACHEICTSRHK